MYSSHFALGGDSDARCVLQRVDYSGTIRTLLTVGFTPHCADAARVCVFQCVLQCILQCML